jgi:hypothetical protein
VLEARRRDDVQEAPQAFYAGLTKPRELTHDSAVYRAYRRASGRLRKNGADLHRVVLDYELKREYQQFLQECNRERRDSDGRPRRTERKSPSGRDSTACPTSTTRCTSPTSASSTRTATDIAAPSMSRW